MLCSCSVNGSTCYVVIRCTISLCVGGGLLGWRGTGVGVAWHD